MGTGKGGGAEGGLKWMGAATGDGCEHIHRNARVDELDIVRVPACDGYGIPCRMVSRPTWYPVPRGVVSQHGILREYNRLYDVSTNICAATGPTPATSAPGLTVC
jgi:hypothetical protein